MPAFIDITGMTFGRWKVIDYAGKCKWNCRCECGATHKIASRNLRCGRTLGCFACHVRVMTIHGHGQAYPGCNYSTPTYQSWRHMLQRCRNPKVKSFKRYGGRGITVCERWNSFVNFLADMGVKPSGLELDRKDNDGNYEPSNCRWATKQQQCQNRSTTHWVMLGREKLPSIEAARRLGVWRHTLERRIERLGLHKPQMAEIVSVDKSTKRTIITVKIADVCCA